MGVADFKTTARKCLTWVGVILSSDVGAYLARAGFRGPVGSPRFSPREGGCLDLRMSERTYWGRPTVIGIVCGIVLAAARWRGFGWRGCYRAGQARAIHY